jgi:hypothetical protein
LFVQTLVIMIVHHLHTVNELLVCWRSRPPRCSSCAVC